MFARLDEHNTGKIHGVRGFCWILASVFWLKLLPGAMDREGFQLSAMQRSAFSSSTISSDCADRETDGSPSPVAERQGSASKVPFADEADLDMEEVVFGVEKVTLLERREIVEEKIYVSEESCSEGEDVPQSEGEDLPQSEYWIRLRQAFVNSNWFRNVDRIMSENYLLNTMIARPAELFFNTATEVFLSSERFSEFLESLKERLGSSWDDRLTPLASTFFSTAHVVSNIVGAGRFVGGALQLGKSTINAAWGQIFSSWEQILGATDSAVDFLLPDWEELHSNSSTSSHDEGVSEGEEDSELKIDPIEGEFKIYQTEDMQSETSDGSVRKKRRRGVNDIAVKVSRRVKQRMPSLQSIGLLLKSRFLNYSWFKRVDEILRQNVILRSLGNMVRPAEHFYDTALDIFVEKKRSLDEFLWALKLKLGAAWDDRLTDVAREFYDSATEASEAEFDDFEPQRNFSNKSLATRGEEIQFEEEGET